MINSVLRRDDIISQYHLACAHLNLTPEHVRLTCGGACVLHGLRERTADLDLEVKPLIFKKITRDPKYVVQQGLMSRYVQFSNLITVHESEPFGPITMIDGVHVVSIPKIHKVYDLLSRNLYRTPEKRAKDLELLSALGVMFSKPTVS